MPHAPLPAKPACAKASAAISLAECPLRCCGLTCLRGKQLPSRPLEKSHAGAPLQEGESRPAASEKAKPQNPPVGSPRQAAAAGPQPAARSARGTGKGKRAEGDAAPASKSADMFSHLPPYKVSHLSAPGLAAAGGPQPAARSAKGTGKGKRAEGDAAPASKSADMLSHLPPSVS